MWTCNFRNSVIFQAKVFCNRYHLKRCIFCRWLYHYLKIGGAVFYGGCTITLRIGGGDNSAIISYNMLSVWTEYMHHSQWSNQVQLSWAKWSWPKAPPIKYAKILQHYIYISNILAFFWLRKKFSLATKLRLLILLGNQIDLVTWFWVTGSIWSPKKKSNQIDLAT